MTREEAVEAFIAACREQLAAEAARERKKEALRELAGPLGIPVTQLPTLLTAALARAGFTDEEIAAVGVTRENLRYLVSGDPRRKRTQT